jgi:hypothetical protein
MTPAEALDLITQATEKYLGTKADHFMLQQALDVMKEAIKPLPDQPLKE